VPTPKLKSTIDVAAAQLRSIVLAAEEGALLGSEETLIATLGVSRATVRQVARLLEREGLVRVRRGINGGYFAARPDIRTIETTVSAYLEMLHTEAEDVTVIASVLWVEVLRRAARIRTEESKALAEKYLDRVRALRLDATFHDVLRIEQESRRAIFDLINSPYIELIFQINTAFAQRRFAPPSERDDTESHRDFVCAWRSAKLLELESIADGDPELAMMAARHGRNLWHRRIWNHDTP
jgi:GntR family transcriptional repressor for pyruvate dehydrogenase complex